MKLNTAVKLLKKIFQTDNLTKLDVIVSTYTKTNYFRTTTSTDTQNITLYHPDERVFNVSLKTLFISVLLFVPKLFEHDFYCNL